MSMSAARIRSMFRRHEEAHNNAFMFAENADPSGSRSAVATPRPAPVREPRALNRREIVMQQFGSVMQRELARAGLA